MMARAPSLRRPSCPSTAPRTSTPPADAPAGGVAVTLTLCVSSSRANARLSGATDCHPRGIAKRTRPTAGPRVRFVTVIVKRRAPPPRPPLRHPPTPSPLPDTHGRGLENDRPVAPPPLTPHQAPTPRPSPAG